jgi:hypothetical protein
VDSKSISFEDQTIVPVVRASNLSRRSLVEPDHLPTVLPKLPLQPIDQLTDHSTYQSVTVAPKSYLTSPHATSTVTLTATKPLVTPEVSRSPEQRNSLARSHSASYPPLIYTSVPDPTRSVTTTQTAQSQAPLDKTPEIPAQTTRSTAIVLPEVQSQPSPPQIDIDVVIAKVEQNLIRQIAIERERRA